MRRSIGSLLLISIVFAGAATTQAQTAPDLSRGPDRGAHIRIPGIEIPPYPNLPFSGTDTIVWTRSTDNGGAVSVSATSKVARDSQGRIYRERHHFAPEDADQAKTLFEFYILDPTAHTRTACEIATHRCTVTTYHPQLAAAVMPAGPFDNGRRYLSRESLGTQTLDDLPVVGTRETVTIASGTVGNDRPITVTREFWYSTDLKINLAVTRKDESGGTQAVSLAIDSRAEPDSSLFTLPSKYTVEDKRPSQDASN